jgi:hypothetical protein
MTPDAPFLLSIAALSASLAGLAGLVAALRRGEGLSTNDRYRLHEIVEFCFANILFAVSMIPLTSLTGDVQQSLRIGAAVAIVYLLVSAAVLTRRARDLDIPIHGPWFAVAASLNIAALLTAAAAALTGSVGAFQALLVILLARPMVAFLFVLSSFESSGERGRSD